jgi:hypothetical protein
MAGEERWMVIQLAPGFVALSARLPTDATDRFPGS